MAVTASRRRRTVALPEFSKAFLGASVQGIECTLCDTTFGATLVHFNLAGGRHRSWTGGENRRPCQSNRDAWSLYAGCPQRGCRYRGVGPRLRRVKRSGRRQNRRPLFNVLTVLGCLLFRLEGDVVIALAFAELFQRPVDLVSSDTHEFGSLFQGKPFFRAVTLVSHHDVHCVLLSFHQKENTVKFLAQLFA